MNRPRVSEAVAAELLVARRAPRAALRRTFGPAANGACALLLLAMAASALGVDEPQQRGIVLTLTADETHSDVKLARLIALYTPESQRASALLTKAAKQATFEGFINVGLRGRYTFSLEGRGKVSVSINGEVILEGEGDDLSKLAAAEKIRLNKGPNAAVVTYTFPQKGDAWLRLYWQTDEFPREPVPPSALSHDPGRLRLRGEPLIRQGRELFAALRCVRCHLPTDPAQLGDEKTRMPELAIDAPELSAAGARLNEDWMAAWIANPRGLRPDASMPSLHEGHMAAMHGQRAGGGGGMWARDIAAYLATLGDKPKQAEPVPDDKAAIAAGGNLFARLGCIGCHTLPTHNDSASIDNRVSLKYVKAKWQPAALREFLLKPQAHYAWIRMPNFNLTRDEANRLAAFLVAQDGAAAPHVGPPAGRGRPADAGHGKMMIQMAGCLNCHTLKLENQFKAPSLEQIAVGDWMKGCIADKADGMGRSPGFGFSDEQRQALRAFAKAGVGLLQRDTPIEFAERQFHQAQCFACHKRDGENDRWSNHEMEVASLLIDDGKSAKPKVDPNDPFGEEGKAEVQIDQSRPELTWAGEKLRPQWMQQFLAGELDYKLRPWLAARMPAFPARAAWMSQGLAMQHGHPPVAPPLSKPDAEMAAVGRELSGKSGDGKQGFACVLCHGVGKAPAENVFEAQGINFMYSAERLNKEFYMRWMLKPMRVWPNTRMPQFAGDDGLTPFTNHYDGDARRQFEAIWEYLKAGREIGKP